MIYLNHASISIPYPESILAAQDFLKQWERPTFKYSQFMIDINLSVKEKFGKIIQCEAKNLSFMPNTSLGLSLILNAHPFEQGDEILFLDNEFPGNAYPYLSQEPRGVHCKQISSDSFYKNPLETLEKAVSSNSKILALSLVGYTSGYKADLAMLSSFCKAKNIKLYVDATQATGITEINVKKTPVDVLITSGYKWLRFQPATTLAYIQSEYLDQLVPLQGGWLSIEDRPNTHYPLSLEHASDGRKFEQGGMNLMGLITANAALDKVLETGIPAIQLELKKRTDLILAECSKRQIQTLLPYTELDTAGIISFFLDGDTDAIAEALKKEEIWITYRNGCFRLSPHYNTSLDDIRYFFEAVDRIIQSL